MEQPAPTRARRRLVQDLAIPLALVVGTLLLYARVANHSFLHWDDQDYVSENPHVLQGLSLRAVAWAFTTTWAGNWHPLTWLSHLLDVQLFGPSAGAHHLVNAALHALNALLLYRALSRLTGAAGPSALVAALFAAHPLNVESVAWVAERPGGGRGFGYTGGHYHENWSNNQARKLVLNGILWTAGMEIPPDGVASTVTEAQLKANLDPKGN